MPEIERQQNLGKEVVFRADAAFAKPENRKICVTRSDQDRYIYGAYHVANTHGNEVIDYVRDLECYGRQLGVMAEWEELSDE